MKLVIDTNILIAALIKNSTTRKILSHPEMEFFVPEFIFEEVEKYHSEIQEKSGLSQNELGLLFETRKQKLILVSDEERQHKEEAQKVMDSIDLKDSIFIALALSTHNEGIWSEDKHFEQQNRVKVWKTKDILKYLDIE